MKQVTEEVQGIKPLFQVGVAHLMQQCLIVGGLWKGEDLMDDLLGSHLVNLFLVHPQPALCLIQEVRIKLCLDHYASILI